MYAHALACTPKEISMKVTVTVTPASPLPGWALPSVAPPPVWSLTWIKIA